MTRWEEVSGAEGSARYAARFEALAASGADVHGEARFVASLVPPGSRVLDAGCGTGRVAIHLAASGYDCTGVDVSEAMLAEARRQAPELTWLLADLATLDLGRGFDLVVAAGNVVPLVAEGTEETVVGRLGAHVRSGGLLVAGFGLDAAHLPAGTPAVALADYDRWCAAAGLDPAARLATWDGDPYDGGGYAVSVHRRPGP